MSEGDLGNHQTARQPPFRGRVRMRTLAFIRWIAVVGQLVTLLTVHYGLGYPLPIGPAMAVIMASALFNIWSWSRSTARTRLSNQEATLSLGFDILQLSLLLYLTGGLQNPFSLLILAPVTISATILSRASAFALGILSAVCITVLGIWHLPLPWAGTAFDMPKLYALGVWLAIVLSITLLAAYNWSVAEEGRRMSDALSATQTELAREQRVSALGMLAALTAHRLGSPLATITVAAKEIARDVGPDNPFAEDAALILGESERCREILAGLSGDRDDESPFAKIPLTALIQTAAAAQIQEHVAIRIRTDAMPRDSALPVVFHSSEVVHGLSSLIENAVQFARATVIVTIAWTPAEITIEICDDGPGFSPHIMPQLGEPYISSRKSAGGHMGLGVFIAQTLLERTGATLAFANRKDGAAVTVRWPRQVLESGGEAAVESAETAAAE